MDIKSDFLQGKSIERDVTIKPPKEVNTNKLWKLKNNSIWIVRCTKGMVPKCEKRVACNKVS